MPAAESVERMFGAIAEPIGEVAAFCLASSSRADEWVVETTAP